MPSEDVQKKVEEIDKQIEGLQRKRRELLRAESQQDVEDLESFEKMSSEERAELYRNNPDAYRHYSKLLTERNERALVSESPEIGARP